MDGELGLPPGRAGTEGGLGGSRLRGGSALPSPARGHRGSIGNLLGLQPTLPAGSDGPAAERSPRGHLWRPWGAQGGMLGMLIPSPRYPDPRPCPLAGGVRLWALTRVFVELPWSGTTALWLPRKPFLIRFLAPCSSVAGDVMRARRLCGVLLSRSRTRVEIPDPGAEGASAICLNGWVLMNLSNPTNALDGGIRPQTPPDAAAGSQNAAEQSRGRPSLPARSRSEPSPGWFQPARSPGSAPDLQRSPPASFPLGQPRGCSGAG